MQLCARAFAGRVLGYLHSHENSLHERTDGRAGGVVVVDSRNSNILLAEI